jgi:hypothetical protein
MLLHAFASLVNRRFINVASVWIERYKVISNARKGVEHRIIVLNCPRLHDQINTGENTYTMRGYPNLFMEICKVSLRNKSRTPPL